MSINKIRLLETTLREGSYSVNFSFSAQDTFDLCRDLESAGFRLIEVGHGFGLNASNRGLGKAAASDEEYMRAAGKALKRAEFGVFCIPGVARLKDLDAAADSGAAFVRIGANASEYSRAEPFFRRAGELGLRAYANFMKTYILSPAKLAQKVGMAERFGADAVFIVDSAGCMFPEDILAYYKAIRKATEVTLGIHAHNNLGLSVWNCLYAADLGFEYFDTSMQGIGRSLGNPSNEMVIPALKRRGYKLDIDILKMLDIGEKRIRPLMSSRGIDTFDVMAGYAGFHSSNKARVLEFAKKHSVDPIVLMVEASKHDRISPSDSLLRRISKRIKDKKTLI